MLTKPVEKFKLSTWHEGLQFLTQAKENWPCFLPTKNIVLSTKEEKRILALNSCATNVDDFEDHLLKRTSSWSKLIRIATWLKRVKLNQNSRSAILTVDELYYAKFNLFWLAQSNLRTAKYQSMRKKLNLKPSTEELGLLRIYGRLNNFSYDEAVTNPIALTSKSKITKLYAEYMHENLGHQGYRVVIINLRQNGIHILRGKQLLKSIAEKCIKCRIARRKLMEQQLGQLPPQMSQPTIQFCIT